MQSGSPKARTLKKDLTKKMNHTHKHIIYPLYRTRMNRSLKAILLFMIVNEIYDGYWRIATTKRISHCPKVGLVKRISKNNTGTLSNKMLVPCDWDAYCMLIIKIIIKDKRKCIDLYKHMYTKSDTLV